MDHGIWAIWYDIAPEHRAAYLDWFHRVHIPEKLLRPGYSWAAHYELGHGGRGAGYVALFGGNSTHTFLNPSPGQLATRQSPETKKFIGMRINAAACILGEEVRIDGPDGEMCAQTRSEWVLVDAVTKRPARVPAWMEEMFT